MNTRTRNRALAFGLAVAAAGLLAQAADAQVGAAPPDGKIEIPVGTWAEAAVQFTLAGALPVALWAIRKLPGEVQFALRMMRIDQVLKTAVNYGLNATRNATAGRALTFQVGNEVLERAVEYAVRHAPQLIGQMKLEEVREKILARLVLDENAAIARIVGPEFAPAYFVPPTVATSTARPSGAAAEAPPLGSARPVSGPPAGALVTN